MSETAKIRLLPIEWKLGSEPGTHEGFIGTFKVGTITTSDKHYVSVIKEGIILTKCEIEFTNTTKESSFQQAKDYVSTKITDRIVSEQNNINEFFDK